jgi:hypothetical protein
VDRKHRQEWKEQVRTDDAEQVSEVRFCGHPDILVDPAKDTRSFGHRVMQDLFQGDGIGGEMDQYAPGITQLVIGIWSTILTIAVMATGFPFGIGIEILSMRSPL